MHLHNHQYQYQEFSFHHLLGLVIASYEITPDPTNSSFKYQATNCPSVMADCGCSNSTYNPLSTLYRVAFCNGCRYRILAITLIVSSTLSARSSRLQYNSSLVTNSAFLYNPGCSFPCPV